MTLSRLRLIFAALIIVLTTAALAATFFLLRRPQTTTSTAASLNSSPPKTLNALKALTPKPGDFNGDGRIDSRDASLFEQKYRASDPAADLDSSGQINVLDRAKFNMLR